MEEKFFKKSMEILGIVFHAEKAKVSVNTFNTSTGMKHLKIRDKNTASRTSALFYLVLLFRVEQTAEKRQLKL